jgi:hypothetical protein
MKTAVNLDKSIDGPVPEVIESETLTVCGLLVATPEDTDTVAL